MKKILNILLVLLFILLLKLILSFVINEIIILNYNNNILNSTLIKILYPINITESYIVYYNEGNILYKKENYSKAIKMYQQAIKKNVPQKRICDIRINLSLSMIKQIDNNYDYTKAYNQLEEAKSNLYKNSCASPIDENGYSKEAEQLEEEIRNLQDQLNSSSKNNQSNIQDKKENTEDENENFSDIEEQLKEIEKESNANRQEDLTTYENMGDYSYYFGKRW